MALDQDKIVKNTKKFFTTATTKGFMTEELMAFLGESFIAAPASTNVDQNNAFEGGLIDHLIKTATYAVKINSALPEGKKANEDSLIKVAFLHQIGKAYMFVPEKDDWWRNNRGRMYDFAPNTISMRTGERSVYYALSNGVKLTEEETAAILMFDKVGDPMAEYHNSRLGRILKTASELAILEEQGK